MWPCFWKEGRRERKREREGRRKGAMPSAEDTLCHDCLYEKGSSKFCGATGKPHNPVCTSHHLWGIFPVFFFSCYAITNVIKVTKHERNQRII